MSEFETFKAKDETMLLVTSEQLTISLAPEFTARPTYIILSGTDGILQNVSDSK